MFSRVALVVLAVVVGEFFAFGFAVDRLGLATVIWLSLGLLALGIFLLRRNLSRLVGLGLSPLGVDGTDAEAVPQALAARGGQAADRALLIVSGLLLVVPGIITAVAGLALLVPPVRTLVQRSLKGRLDALVVRGVGAPDGVDASVFGSFRRFGGADIVDVDVRPRTSADDSAPRSSSAPPELN
ncbi:MAG: FxsA family protein [Actinomycetota bacterium]